MSRVIRCLVAASITAIMAATTVSGPAWANDPPPCPDGTLTQDPRTNEWVCVKNVDHGVEVGGTISSTASAPATASTKKPTTGGRGGGGGATTTCNTGASPSASPLLPYSM